MKMTNLIGKERLIIRTTEALENKFKQSKMATITLKLKNGDTVIIDRNSEGYHLYDGCELIVGDVSLKYIAMTLIQINNDSKLKSMADGGELE